MAVGVAAHLECRPARREPLGLAARRLAAEGRLEEALRILSTLTGEWRPAWAGEQMVRGPLDSGRISEAELVAPTIERARDVIVHGGPGDPDYGRAAMLRVAEYLINDGQITRALKFAEHFGPTRADSRALAQTARLLANTGDLIAAVEVTGRIQRPAIRAETLLSMAEALARAGQDPGGPLCEASRSVTEISSIGEAWEMTGAVLGTAVKTLPEALGSFSLDSFWDSVTG
jgi:hypothetical protein